MLRPSETQIVGLATLMAALTGAAALAQGTTTGATANGCSYAVINGVYTHSCQTTSSAAATIAPSASPTPGVTPAPLQNAASYAEAREPAPVLQIQSEPPRNQSLVVKNDTPPAPPEGTSARAIETQSFSDPLFLGSSVGSFSVTESRSGAATSLGLSVTQNLDDFVGFELGYTWAKSSLHLGLAERAGQPTSARTQSDASLTNHLVTGEVQFHLSDTRKRLRPFAGVGLGWRAASLEEDAPAWNGYGAGSGSLSQNGLGLTGSLGAKVRLADRYQLTAGMRYFRPLSTQDASLSAGTPSAYGAASSTRLTPADAALTSSSTLLLYGGLHIAL